MCIFRGLILYWRLQQSYIVLELVKQKTATTQEKCAYILLKYIHSFSKKKSEKHILFFTSHQWIYIYADASVHNWISWEVKKANVLTIIVSKDWVIKRKITQKWRMFFIIKIMWIAKGYWMLVILSNIHIISMYNMMIVLPPSPSSPVLH